jgi:hypothetical protein
MAWLAMALLVANAVAERPRVEVATACGVAAKVPAGWRASRSRREKGVCTFGVAPRGWARMRKHSDVAMAEQAVMITVVDEELASSADSGALSKFVGRDGRGWFFRGRAYTTIYGAESRSACCLVVEATNEIGTYGKGAAGGYLGTGEARAALVGGAGKAALLQSDPSLNEQDEVVALMARSLRFIASRPTRR